MELELKERRKELDHKQSLSYNREQFPRLPRQVSWSLTSRKGLILELGSRSPLTRCKERGDTVWDRFVA